MEAAIADQTPLAGVRVLDLSQAYLGPYCTWLMAKAGADVIKVESRTGDLARLRSSVNKGAVLPFAMINTNKRSMVLNLKHPDAIAIVRRMVLQVDVLVENFAPGVLDRLGIGWEVLREINPRLVYASGSGFGLSGPSRDRLAMDISVQAVSGAMSITGTPDGPPMKAGPAIADFLSGIHLYGGIVTALLQRTRTGKGCLVEVAMQEAMYPALASSLGILQETGFAPRGTGNRHGGMALCPYSVYPASDGWLSIACVYDDHWKKLVQVMGMPALSSDPRYATVADRCARMQEVDDMVGDWTRGQGRNALVDLLEASRVPVAPVRDLKEVMHDPHMHQRGMLEWIDDPVLGQIVVPNSPLRLHGSAKPGTVRRPELGEQTDEILAEMLGLSEADIGGLRSAGAL